MAMMHCSSGRQAIIKTSNTSCNPERRYYCCPSKGTQCRGGFICWVNEGSVDTMPAILRAMNMLQVSNEQLVAANNVLEEKIKASEVERLKLKTYLTVIVAAVIVIVIARLLV